MSALSDITTIEPDKMGGVPCIRGLRFPVRTLAGLCLGCRDAEILADFPSIVQSDIDAVRAALASGELVYNVHKRFPVG